MAEVAQPSSEDELNFKEKHIIDPKDHPVAPEHVFSGAVDKDDVDGMKRYRKNKRLADYQAPEDAAVYEGVSLTRDMPGQEDSDVDNNDKDNRVDSQLRYRRHAQLKMHKIDEGKGLAEKVTEPYAVGMAQAMKSTGDKPPLSKKTITLAHKIAKGIEKNEALDPVGKENKDIDNNGKITKHDEYLHNRRKAISQSIRTKIKEGFGSVTAVGGDYDEEESHKTYKKGNISTKKEAITLANGKGLKVFAGKTKESQIDEAEVNEGPFKGLGKMMMKRNLKKDMSKHDDEMDSDLDKGWAGDNFVKAYDEKKRKQKALSRLNREETELDEVSDQKLDTYRQKAFADQPAGDDGSDKYRKRKFGRDLAFAKQTGRAKVLATKESVELDEAPGKRVSSAFHMTVPMKDGQVHPDHAEKITALKAKVRADNAEEGTKKKVILQGRLGKDNPNASKYKSKYTGKSFPGSHQRIKLGDASHADVYVREEVENLDELKKSTLSSYIKKASGNMAGNSAVAAAQASSSMRKSTPEVKRNIGNRMKGITRASDKLANEEVEQIDELSKDTLTSYAIKAHRKGDMAARMSKSGADKDMANYANKRFQGVQTAIKKLGEESRIDEAFKEGAVKLNDGSSVILRTEDVKVLNKLMDGLKTENKSKMMTVAMKNKKGFNEILSFAKEAI